MIENNKDSQIRIRIKKELKEKFSQILEKKGDTMSGFLNRTIVRYVEKYEKEL